MYTYYIMNRLDMLLCAYLQKTESKRGVENFVWENSELPSYRKQS